MRLKTHVSLDHDMCALMKYTFTCTDYNITWTVCVTAARINQ